MRICGVDPHVYISMDHETPICHLVALWVLPGTRVLRALAERSGSRAGASDPVPAAGTTRDFVLHLDQDSGWATLLARDTFGDTQVELRSRGVMARHGRVAEDDRDAFLAIVSRVALAVEEVFSAKTAP